MNPSWLAWATPFFNELSKRALHGNTLVGLCMGVFIVFWAIDGGFITTPKVTELMVKVTELEARIEMIQAQCDAYVAGE